jgi:F420-dependent oxidoreductase-like protein
MNGPPVAQEEGLPNRQLEIAQAPVRIADRHMSAGDNLEFGIHAPPEGKDFNTMKTLCQTAERLNYDLFTVTDHFMNMANPTGAHNHPLESWSTLAGLAAVTSRIKLGPLVSCVNYRHPTVLAKTATTVDIISGGRLLFGIGAGWHEPEFNGYLGRFPSAGDRLDGLEDAIQICRSMFTNEHTTYKGKTYSASNTLNSPRPVQKSIPILVGGSGEKRTLKVAAKYADIGHLFASSPEELKHKIDVLKSHVNRAGRTGEVRIAVGHSPIVDPLPDNIGAQVERFLARHRGQMSRSEAEKMIRKSAGAQNIIDLIKDYRRLGVSLVTLNVSDVEGMKSLEDQVISKLRE